MSENAAATGSAGPRLVIRAATSADGPAVRGFVFGTLRSYGIEPDPAGLDADVMAFGQDDAEGSIQLVAEVEGQVVGSVAVNDDGEGRGHLSKFFMDARFRGRGYGRPLLAAAIEAASAYGYRSLKLETRTAFLEAVHLYEAMGWVRGPDLPIGYGPDRTYTLAL